MINITVEDTEKGTKETVEVDTWFIVTVGRYYVASEQRYPQTGTAQITIKRTCSSIDRAIWEGDLRSKSERHKPDIIIGDGIPRMDMRVGEIVNPRGIVLKDSRTRRPGRMATAEEMAEADAYHEEMTT